jgi:hypothetical protein
MCFLARDQRDSLRTIHPLEKNHRASVERAADEIEAAIAAYEADRPR